MAIGFVDTERILSENDEFMSLTDPKAKIKYVTSKARAVATGLNSLDSVHNRFSALVVLGDDTLRMGNSKVEGRQVGRIIIDDTGIRVLTGFIPNHEIPVGYPVNVLGRRLHQTNPQAGFLQTNIDLAQAEDPASALATILQIESAAIDQNLNPMTADITAEPTAA
jgi:hypothetical protein